MPNGRKITSKAQWRKLQLLVHAGKMSQADFDDMSAGIDYDKLPNYSTSGEAEKGRMAAINKHLARLRSHRKKVRGQ